MDKHNIERKSGSTTLGNWDDSIFSKGSHNEETKPLIERPAIIHRAENVIYEEVWEALYQRKEINTGEVEVVVSEGTVYLRGIIDTRLGRHLAALAIKDISGVLEIKNELWIRQHRRLISPDEDDTTESKLPHGLINNLTGLN